jgi:hypothetical protein
MTGGSKMKTCDVCQKPLGVFNKFRYADGYICKECYKKASNHFAETIVKKNLSEIKELCERYEATQTDEFQITGKIGNFLLIDEIHQKICLPNNRMVKKEAALPEFYAIEDIEQCRIEVDPKQSIEALEHKAERREDGTVNYLKVKLWITGNKKLAEISLISNPVRIKSYAFRQSLQFARKIEQEINRLTSYEETEGGSHEAI